MTMTNYPLADATLARRLEATEGAANRAFIEARARVQPAVGACWIEVGGALAMFDGPASPVTQTFGLGMFEVPTAAHLERMESFFRERAAPVNHETSPLADAALLPLLAARGYRPVEYSSVMYRPAALAIADRPAHLRVIRVGAEESDRWARTAAEGWSSEGAHLVEFVYGLGALRAASDGFASFLVVDGGVDIAAGSLFVHDGMALLAGASTIPSARRRGAQRALLAARLEAAVDAGCGLAMMVALPGSASQRNAERQGFRIAYTRIKWQA